MAYNKSALLVMQYCTKQSKKPKITRKSTDPNARLSNFHQCLKHF